MNTFLGADTDKLRAHADLLRDRATAIEDLRSRLEPIVLHEGMWKGPDADAFRARWTSEASSKFSESASTLQRWGGDLDAQADEQDTTSDSDGGGTGSGSGAGQEGGQEGGQQGQERSLWSRIWQGMNIYAKAQGLFNKGKKIWDLAKVFGTGWDMLKSSQDVFDLVLTRMTFNKGIADAIFKPGQEFGEMAKGILGKIGVPQGFGKTNIYGWADNLIDRVAPFMKGAGPWIGKALPAVDIVFGGMQLYNSLQKGDTFHAWTGGAQALGGTMMLAGAAMSATGVGAVAGGPIALAGAVISGGAAIADLGKLAVDNWPQIQEAGGKAWNWAAENGGKALDTAGDALGDAASAAGDALDDAGSKIAGGLRRVFG